MDIEKDFLCETFPYLFEAREAEPGLITTLASGTILDKLVLLLLIAPVLVTCYPQLKAATRRSRNNTTRRRE